MDGFEFYKETVVELLDSIARMEREKIDRAADIVATALKEDKLIHVFGTGGHSFMAAEEMFYRAGGLVPVNPIFEQGVTTTHGALRSTMLERLPGYAGPVLEYYGVGEGDVLIVSNAYGINSVTIDAAIEGKKRGCQVIAITSSEHAQKVPPSHPARHPSKRNLFQLKEVDVYIDCHMPYGDAVVALNGLQQKVGPVSTILVSFILNEIVITVAEKLLAQGIVPPIWSSENVVGGAERNREFKKMYFNRIKHL